LGRASLLCLSAALAPPLPAQDVQPRSLNPAPVGSNLVSFIYSFSTGAVLTDKTIPVQNIDGDIHTFAGAYGRAFGFFGQAAKADLIVPFTTGRWSGVIQEVQLDSTVSRTGFGDPIARFMFFFVGAPALSGPEFIKHRSRTVAGASIRLRVPLGQYDPTKIINIGTNRWMVSPRIGLSQSFGRFLTELYASGWFFTDNPDYLNGNLQSQNPMGTLQLHFIWVFGPGFWVAAGTRQSFGGQVFVNGTAAGEALTNNRIGVALTVPISRRQGIKVALTFGLSTAAGNDYNTFAGSWQAAWGAFPHSP
jgi:hypothetical protein